MRENRPDERHAVPVLGVVPDAAGTLPFPLVPLDGDHPSGCADDCDFPLHLTPRAVAVLQGHSVPVVAIRAALDGEAAVHVRDRVYPVSPSKGWTSRVELALRNMGVSEAVIEQARAVVERRLEKAGKRALRAAGARDESLAARQEYLRKWRADNRDKVNAHSRAYRQRIKAVQ